MEGRSVADVEGPWVEPDLDSSLVERCRQNWSVPVVELSNYALSTFLRQRFALQIVIPEGQRRLKVRFVDGTELYKVRFVDGTELYDDELADAVQEALNARPNNASERTRGL